jgi:hypothetical protein
VTNHHQLIHDKGEESSYSACHANEGESDRLFGGERLALNLSDLSGLVYNCRGSCFSKFTKRGRS